MAEKMMLDRDSGNEASQQKKNPLFSGVGSFPLDGKVLSGRGIPEDNGFTTGLMARGKRVHEFKLLGRVNDIYRDEMSESAEARRWLEDRGITNAQIIESLRVYLDAWGNPSAGPLFVNFDPARKGGI